MDRNLHLFCLLLDLKSLKQYLARSGCLVTNRHGLGLLLKCAANTLSLILQPGLVVVTSSDKSIQGATPKKVVMWRRAEWVLPACPWVLKSIERRVKASTLSPYVKISRQISQSVCPAREGR